MHQSGASKTVGLPLKARTVALVVDDRVVTATGIITTTEAEMAGVFLVAFPSVLDDLMPLGLAITGALRGAARACHMRF